MRGFAVLIVASTLAVSCGGESEDGTGTGGSSTGGSVTGGTGGSVTGGTGGSTTGGTGGTTTGGTGGGVAALPECKEASDCKVFEDCCSCEGIPKSANPGICKLGCTTKKCGVLGVSSTEVSCIAGRCVVGFDCNTTGVVCLGIPPKCPAGEVPQVKGSCWTGACVPTTECKDVTGCADCDSQSACVTYIAKPGPKHHCVDVPLACGGNASCSCFGPSVCTGNFNTCTDLSGVKGVTCGCPTC